MRLLARWLLGAVSLWLTVQAAKALGVVGLAIDSAPSALVSVAVLTIVNQVVGPLLGFFAWPLNCLTLGLFRVAVGAALFWLVGNLGLGLRVDGFIPGLFGSVALALISGILDQFIPVGRKKS